MLTARYQKEKKNIYCHPQRDYLVVSQIFSVARHERRLKLGSKPLQHYGRNCIIPLSQQANNVISGIIRLLALCSNFRWFTFCAIRQQRAQFIRRTLHYANGSCKFLHLSTQPPYIYIYIYIYIYMCVCVCVCVYIYIYIYIVVSKTKGQNLKPNIC